MKDEKREDKITMYEEEFKRINYASKNRSLTFFVGAGISAVSGAPSWKKLIQKICREIQYPVKEIYSSDESLKIPQMYYYAINKNKQKYYQFIKSMLTNKKIGPNVLHKELLKFNPVSFITTNFDDLIEEAALQNFQSYKVVACDDEVSSINGDRYILKIHGDLKHKNIVFKEEDYLNYSENFKLTETMLKSIFSTNTVVFIGYGLNDYNIKLILNWTKELLKDHFNKPIFIYTGDEILTEEERVYQESKGLSVIEYQKITEATDNYFERYMAVLEAMKSSTYLSLSGKDEETLFNILYELLMPLNRINALRIIDVYLKLKNFGIHIGENGIIYIEREEQKLFSYFCKINNFSIAKYKSLPKTIQEKYEVILNVLTKAYIKAIKVGAKFISIEKQEMKFADLNCIRYNYEYMLSYIRKKTILLDEKYKKGFYYARLKKYDKAFYCFAEIANQAFASEDYLTYYFAQINCINLKKIIKNINIIYDCYDINEIERSMPAKIDTEYFFENLPLHFKSQYASLKDLHSVNLLYKFSYDAFLDGKKLSNALDTNSVEWGLTSTAKVVYRLNRFFHFVLGNGIVIDVFAEVKNTIKNLMSLLLYKYTVQEKRMLSISSLPIKEGSNDIYFDELDFYCFLEYFDSKELIKVLNKYNVKNLKFEHMDSIEDTVINILVYYDELIKNKSLRFEVIYLQRQIQTLLVILRYVTISQKLVDIICRFLFKYEFEEIYINDKIYFLQYQIKERGRYSEVTSRIIEDKLISYIDTQINKVERGESFKLLSTNSNINYYNLINYIKPDNENYHSRRVAKRILYILKNNLSEMIPHIINNYWYCVSSYTKRQIINWTRNRLEESFKFDLFTLLVQCESKIDKKLVELLKQYLQNTVRKEHEKSGINVYPPTNPYEELEQVGYWCLLQILPKKEFEKFLGVSDAFDFYIQYNNFDFSKFDVSWLLKLYPHTLREISRDKYTKDKIRSSIAKCLDTENILDSDRKKISDILVRYFC